MRRLVLLLLAALSADAQLVRESLTGTHRVLLPRQQYLRRIVQEAPFKPFAYDYDRVTGALVRRVPLFFHATQPARVFNPNPVVATNDPSLRDNSDAATAVPEHAYELTSLDLLGPHARLVERQSPSAPLPDPNAPLLFDRGDDRFEPVNASWHIERTQRHLQSLGYVGARQLVPYAIEVDALAANGADESFFLPIAQTGRGALFFGTGGTDDAEDADLVVHEYGHAILEWIAPGTFTGTFGSEARALSEGICDYLAFSQHYDERVASGRDRFCFADWDARCAGSENCAYPPGSDCLRRLDSPRTMADFSRSDTSGTEHRNGQIWSSALRELFLAIGKPVTDTLVIESVFSVPPDPSYAVMARRMIETDRLLYDGTHAAAICTAFTARGIAVSCDGTPRGELTLVPSPARGIAIPDVNPTGITSELVVNDTRTIERVAVRVDVDHSARGDLRIELHAPDGTRVVLQNPSGDITSGIHATYGIDASTAESLDVLRGISAAGTWRLVVADVRTRDAGVLQSWGLVFQFAGDEPLADRPRSDRRQMIPVVAHVFGAGATTYVSNVDLANVTSTPQTATLIFTRSGANGLDDFSAVDVHLEPGHSASFDDIVSGLFFTTGSGSLEVLGEVRATSRLENERGLGQEIPPGRFSFRFDLHGLEEPNARYNVGITEARGIATRVVVDGREIVLQPFSHVQFPADANVVVTSELPILAYLSQVDTASGDAMFITQQENGIAPAISALGADRTLWRTDFWSDVPWRGFYRGAEISGGPGAYFDVVGHSFPNTAGPFGVEQPGGLRITNGRASQYIPFRQLTDRPLQHLIGLENDESHRTNIGMVAGMFGFAEVVVFDAGGREVERQLLALNEGLAQIGIGARISGGRAEVRALGILRGRAWASVIDRRSGDAAFVDGQ